MTRITKVGKKRFETATDFKSFQKPNNLNNKLSLNSDKPNTINRFDSNNKSNPTQFDISNKSKQRFKRTPNTNNTINEPQTTFNESSIKSRKPNQSFASTRDRHKQCFQCRAWGHSAKNCKLALKQCCYICGKNDHTITQCLVKKNPENPFPFASCFVCKEQGHLSRDCTLNSLGIYPNGGSCSVCDSVRHLVKDCPEKVKYGVVTVTIGVVDPLQNADCDDLHVELIDHQKIKIIEKKKGNVVMF